jgi:hypothetical protein
MKKLRYGVGPAGVWIEIEGHNEPSWCIHRQALYAELNGNDAVLSVVYDVHGRVHFMMHLAGYKQSVYRTAVEMARRHWEKQNGV